MQKLGLLDWDGTLRCGFTVRDWVAFLVKSNCLPAGTESRLERLFRRYSLGKMTHDTLADNTARCVARDLRGKSTATIAAATRDFLKEDRKRMHPFAVHAFRFFKRHGYTLAVISGAPAEVLLGHAPFLPPGTLVFGMQYDTRAGRYTGMVRRNLGIARVKANIVHRLLARMKADRFTVAMGNSASDAPLFHSADIAVVVDGAEVATPCPKVQISVGDNWTKVARLIARKENTKWKSLLES